MPWYPQQLFQLLEVVGIFKREILLNALENLQRAIKMTEDKRGTGANKMLR